MQHFFILIVQRGLVRNYHDLGWINSKPNQLIQESKEQICEKLNQLTPDQTDKIFELTQNYKRKFGFSFIICARSYKKDDIFEAMEQRYKNDEKVELNIALEQILLISTFRVKDIISMDSNVKFVKDNGSISMGLTEPSNGIFNKRVIEPINFSYRRKIL